MNALCRDKALFTDTSFGSRSALIDRLSVVKRALKAAAEAQSREQRAIRATTIFFWFFSYEKEKNEDNSSLPLF
ncbi:hypothetical protein WCX18_07685 [Sulfurimonas sp. HSL1-2]|uniref:hypothetical protein n=1 Tax=Thiomicrolovo zhangzhouensis TaxID=3131933 RepID=UPI0031F8E4B4